MGKQSNKIYLLFNNYGNIEKLDDSGDSIAVYKFSINPNILFSNEELLSHIGSVKFMLMVKQSDCYIYCFRIYKKDGIEDDILSIINKINGTLEYGKYILDSDGDINWEYKFDMNCTSPNDVAILLRSFVKSVLVFATYINEYKLKKKKRNNNEEE